MTNPAPTPVKRPKSRGRIMDFTPRKPIVATPRPMQRPVIKMPAPQAYPAPQPQPQPHPYYAAPHPHPAPRPHPAPHPHPAPQPRPVPPRPHPTPQPVPAPAPHPAPLGVRSPFFKKSIAVEKRPLSGAPRPRLARRQSTPPEDLPHPRQIPHSSTIKPASRKSKLPLVLLIIGTILVGAAVGACIYFLVFQGE